MPRKKKRNQIPWFDRNVRTTYDLDREIVAALRRFSGNRQIAQRKIIEAALKRAIPPEYFEPIKPKLNGKQLDYPRVAPEVTFKKTERKNKGEEPEQGQLF